VIVCRGNIVGDGVSHAVILVDGDIDLTYASGFGNSLIRASGDIHLPPNVKPENCTIEAHAKNATAPYKFFEFADVGLSLADDEEGLVVRDVKAETPFGHCGIAKGDLIRAIDDVPAGHSEEFRKKVRRALVRQGDCLITVVRGDKTIDLPVFFPLPK
jgi:predicted metalloprotease with PDZ domain